MSTMTASGYLPNTPDDRAGLIVIFAAVGISWSATVLVFRLCGSLLRRNGLGVGDWTIVFLTCMGTACSIAVFLAVKYGLGERSHLRLISNDDNTARSLYASDMLYVSTLGCSKFATIQLIRGLSPDSRHNQICHGLSAIAALWTVSAIFAIALRCNLSAPALDLTVSQCPSLFSRWASLEAISLAIEVSIFIFTAEMIRHLQMALQKKLTALAIFAVRLPLIIAVAFRLVYLNKAFHSSDYIFEATGAVIAAQCVLHYSVMSTSFFYLKPFLAAFNSNLGASTKLDTVVATRSSDRKAGSSNRSKSWQTAVQGTFQPKPQTHSAGNTHVERNTSVDSDAPIIWQTRSYDVEVADP